MAPLRPIPGAVALLLAFAAQAQDATLPAVRVTPSAVPAAADVTGFGDLPLREVPVSATVIGRQQIEQAGARRLADLTALDASVADAYNATGYWDFLSIRGFTLDNRFNYRREGLPISAETMIPLDNKERIEILKGTSGIQAGTSAPGGLVNYVVKRPLAQPLREARLEISERGSVLLGTDLSSRFGAGGAFGLRINAAHEQLRPQVRNTDGQRSVLAAAGDWRLSRDTVLDAEVEWSQREQASQVGFSLLGNTLPAPADPRLNLNNQAWLPKTEFGAFTGSLRLQQALGTDWSWSAQLGTQRLRTDDRTAFPFGCTDAGTGTYYADRYCPNGDFDMYDYRSDNERRRQDAAALGLRGKLRTGGITHEVSAGLLRSRVENRFQRQAYNYIGTGNVNGGAQLAPSPALTGENTNRDEHATELSLQDAIRWNERFSTWLGLRHTRLSRETVRTDGSQPTAYRQGLTTPWLALSYKLAGSTVLYGSYGEGAESEVVPGLPRYTNAGQALATLKSRQREVGIKGGEGSLQWSAALFRIDRPASADQGACDATAGSCTRVQDGGARHTGIELTAGQRFGALAVDAGMMLLDAKRRGGTLNPAVNGRQPINVPERTFKARANYQLATVPGLSVGGALVHEGRRAVLADESIMLPSWTRVDAVLNYETRIAGTATRWSLGIDNLLDRRYWRESPNQFSHVYLYPGAPRTLRFSLTAAL